MHVNDSKYLANHLSLTTLLKLLSLFFYVNSSLESPQSFLCAIAVVNLVCFKLSCSWLTNTHL